MATATVYAGAGDGFVRKYGGAWSGIAATGSVTGNDAGPTSTGDYLCMSENTNPMAYRGFLPFNLSAVLPNAATITAVDLHLYITGNGSAGGGTTDNNSVCVVKGTPASNTTLATTDYGNVGSTLFAARAPFSGFTTSADNVISLNAAGIAEAQTKADADGYLVLALRAGYDLDNTAPGGNSNIQTRYSEYAATTYDPYIVITYDPPARSTADTWAWSDANAVVGGGGTLIHGYPTTSDTWAWVDSAGPAYVVQKNEEIELFPSFNVTRTTLDGSVNFASLSTITVASLHANAPTAGNISILGADPGNRVTTVSYTGKSGNTLTGCTSWKSSGTEPSGAVVAWQGNEQNFPNIASIPAAAAYPYGRLYAICTRHCGDDADATYHTSDGVIVARYSDNGGRTWSTTEIIQTPVDTNLGIWGTTCAAFDNGTLWVGWYENNIGAICKSYSKYSTDGGATWSSVTQIDPNVFDTGSANIAVSAGPIVDGTDIYVGVYGIDSGSTPQTTPLAWYTQIFKSTDYGASWTQQGVIPQSATGNRATTESALEVLADGSWIIMLRQEVGSTPGDTLDRYRMFSSDKGATWTGGGTAVSSMSNWCNVIRTPDNVLVTYGEGWYKSHYSYDQGATWPGHDNLRFPYDASYPAYSGADQVTVTVPNGTQQIAFVRSNQGGPQAYAQTMFSWYTVPGLTSDAWAWTDSVSRTFTQPRTTGDTWAWTDGAVHNRKTTSDAWAWSDVAVGALSAYYSRTTSDTWAWSDTATRTSGTPVARTTSDTWTWSDAAADTYAGPHYYSRTTTDTWSWSDSTGNAGTALYWLRAARRRSMSAPTKTYTSVQAKGTTRTATWTSPTYKSETEAGILVVLDVTAASGTGGLTLRINAHDLAGSVAVPLNVAPTAVTATGTTSYAVYPFGAISGALTQSTSGYLPRQFSITVTHGDSSSYTYSVGFCLLP